jgi:hypothetical protein
MKELPEHRVEMSAIVELDHARGVLYVHLQDPVLCRELGGQTIVRVQGLASPIPMGMIDINVSGQE